MDLKQKLMQNLQQVNVLSQKGMVEMFDSTIGRSTVLMPFGGLTQRTETQVSVQKLPVGNHFTNTASMMAYGYNPNISTWSPYHGAEYAVVEAIAKIVSAGGRYNNIRFSFQEYFEKMTENPFSWGKPTAALLGALQMQYDFGLPAIGGKDSMSGSFKDINVPPMLMAFGVTKVDANNVISPEFKQVGNYVYFVKHNCNADYTPDTAGLKTNFDFIADGVEQKKIVSGFAVGFGGVAEALCKMAFGNEKGVDVIFDNKEQKDSFEQFVQSLFDLSYGSIVVEATEPLIFDNAILLGRVVEQKSVRVLIATEDGGLQTMAECGLEELYRANTYKYSAVYPITK